MSRAKEIFLDALDCRAAERAAFVAQACGQDVELAVEVERLLAAHTQSNRIFGDSDSVPHGVQPGTSVGAFVLMA